MKLPDLSQVYAAGRHVASFAGGVVFYASVTGVVNSGDAANASHALSQISDGLKEIVAGCAVLVPIGMGAIAAVKASPLVQMLIGATALLHGKADASKMSADDQKTIMEATITLPKVTGVGTSDPAIAASTPSAIVLQTKA